MIRKITFSTISILTLVLISCSNLNKNNTELNTAKKQPIDYTMDSLANAIIIPQFPKKTYNIKDYGANGNGVIDNTKIITDLIIKCNQVGGGKVVIPKGKYLTGAIHLLSNVNLHLEKDSELLFSSNPDHYLPVVHTSYEGTELMNYSPLIYANNQKNIAITGEGTLNGQGNKENWWPWVGYEPYGYKKGDPSYSDLHNRERLIKMSQNNVPIKERIFGKGYQIRPSFIETVMCENILIEGVTIINAPFWVIHPFKSKNITVNKVVINSKGPNNDGCNPEYSSNVHIMNSVFDTGDDCIAIKSGRNDDGRRYNKPSENILVENCTMLDGHGGVVMGSEISAGVRNVYIRNCIMNSPNLDRAIRIKTNTIRGGFVENVYVKDIEVIQVKEAVLRVNTFYGFYGEPDGNFIPSIKNITLENVKVKNGGNYALLIEGREQNPISGIKLINVEIEKVKTPFKISNSQPISFINSMINNVKYNN